MSTKPFPRFSSIINLEWDDCFVLGRRGIVDGFVKVIAEQATKEADNSTRKLAALLYDCLRAATPDDK